MNFKPHFLFKILGVPLQNSSGYKFVVLKMYPKTFGHLAEDLIKNQSLKHLISMKKAPKISVKIIPEIGFFSEYSSKFNYFDLSSTDPSLKCNETLIPIDLCGLSPFLNKNAQLI